MLVYNDSTKEWIVRDPPQADMVYTDFVNCCVSIYMSGIDGSCSGFFVNATGRIVCAGHCVCVAAGGSSGDLVLGTQPFVAPAGSIYVTISNIDGTGRTEVRACSVVGVDLSADIAVLQTDIAMTNQDFLNFGKSRDVANGSKAIIIGDPGGNDFQSVAMGVVRILAIPRTWEDLEAESISQSLRTFIIRFLHVVVTLVVRFLTLAETLLVFMIGVQVLSQHLVADLLSIR